MKKILLTTIILSLFALIGNSQIEINVEGQSTDISGTVLQINIDPSSGNIPTTGEYLLDLEIHNNTGINKSWRITRKELSVPAAWVDMLCFTSCFPPSTLETYCTPASIPLVVDNGASAIVILHFGPELTTATTALYRYYVSNDCSTFEDSVDIQFNYTLGLKSLKNNATFNIAPNPANDYTVVTSAGVENSNVKIVDVLGNVVYVETISSTKKIDLSEFKNGIYFVTIETSDAKISNRKLIVRH